MSRSSCRKLRNVSAAGVGRSGRYVAVFGVRTIPPMAPIHRVPRVIVRTVSDAFQAHVESIA